MPKIDLTGTWHGRFSFPRLYEPVSFTAFLSQSNEWLSGSIQELGVRRESAGNLLHSTVTGKVTGAEILFLKTYDKQISGYDAVKYAGSLDSEGIEISGTWTIPGNWSGTFIMIRSRGLEVVAGKRKAARV